MSLPVHIEPSRRLLFLDAVIANGESLSGEVNLRGYSLKGIIMPSGWTAASVTLQTSNVSGGVFVDVYDDGGAEVSLTVAASRYVGVRADLANTLLGLNVVKVRSGTGAAPVNQLAARTVKLVVAASTL